jgi:hypothetical protein
MNLRVKLLDYAMIALAVVCGIGSIGLLVVVGSSGLVHFGWPEWQVEAWNVFLSLLFFVQHSGMVRRSFRRRLAPMVPARYQGAVYTIASGVALAFVAVFWQPSQIVLVALEGIPRWIAAACSLAAVAVFAMSARSLQSFDPLGLGPIRAHLRGEEHRPGPFILRGAYRWVRHPLYSCIIVLFWTNPELTVDRLLFNVLWTGWIVLGAILEERDLAREFGDAYVRYQQRVPMLIPWRSPVAIGS